MNILPPSKIAHRLAMLTLLLAAVAQSFAPSAAHGQPLTFSKNFAPNPAALGHPTTLFFTITNETTSVVTGMAFTDNLVDEIEIANPAHASTTCSSGSVNAPPGGSVISFSNGQLAALQNCRVQVDVVSDTVGTHPNVTSVLTSSAGVTDPATDDLEVACLGGRSPAFSAPDFLWISSPPSNDDFQPTDSPDIPLPASRDSTGWTSLTIPGFDSGHEIFQGLDIEGDYLYVAYNAGFSVWNIGGANAGTPVRRAVRDGWNFGSCQANPTCGGFLSFQAGGELDFVVEDIDALPNSGSEVFVALSGKTPVGMSLWRFSTSSETLEPVYHEAALDSRQVRLVKVGSTVYALSGSNSGLKVYNMSEANDQAPCLEEPGSPTTCPNVLLGNLGTVGQVRYLDVLQRPTGEILVAVTDGSSPVKGLEIWRVTNLANPSSATRLFTGLNAKTWGTALFSYENNDYVAALEQNGSLNVIKIFNITACSGTTCSPMLVYDDASVPERTSDQFLTFSTSDGTPFLYYGLFGGLSGSKWEHLLDLTTLGRPGQDITEITDGGPTYFDQCAQGNLDYWPWYYSGNEFGFANFTPRIGKFRGNYFYRAAGGMLDVHVRGGGTPDPTTLVTGPSGLQWMSDELTFTATGGGTCDPTGDWSWTPTTPAGVVATVVPPTVGNQITYTFDCTLADRCGDATVSVSATNDDPSCLGAIETPAVVTPVKDPRLAIEEITPASGTFTQCQIVDFEADLLGRGTSVPLIDFAWSVNGVDEATGFLSAGDLSAMPPLSFAWDTSTVVFQDPDLIFADGFESGDTKAWSGGFPLLGSLPVEIELALDGGNTSASVDVDLIPVDGEPMFDPPPAEPITVTPHGDDSTFDFEANTVPGTVSEWNWELEDDNGDDLCVFDGDIDVPCEKKDGQSVSHTWLQQSGERRVDVTIDNCLPSSLPDEASTTVTVASLEPLEVTRFQLNNGLSGAACDIDFDCVQDLVCDCLINETITFEIQSMGEPQSFEFDWDDNGSFEDEHPATDPTTNVYQAPFTGITPRVRAVRGSMTSAERDLSETLNIVTMLP